MYFHEILLKLFVVVVLLANILLPFLEKREGTINAYGQDHMYIV